MTTYEEFEQELKATQPFSIRLYRRANDGVSSVFAHEWCLNSEDTAKAVRAKGLVVSEEFHFEKPTWDTECVFVECSTSRGERCTLMAKRGPYALYNGGDLFDIWIRVLEIDYPG